MNLVGRTFGKFHITKYLGSRDRKIGGRQKWWRALCECGNVREYCSSALTSGRSQSCGCSIGELIRRKKTIHGHAQKSGASPTYKSWTGMFERCSNQHNKSWAAYGGRGITVCERWHDFRNFLSDMGTKPAALSIDRINNDGNYEPGNCRWATPSQQNKNRRPFRKHK